MNKHQRKFFSDLADLMQKYSVSMEVHKSWSEYEGISWNFGSNKTVEHCDGLKPSVIRKMIQESIESAKQLGVCHD